MTNKIKNLIAREVIDSRGNPTVSVEAILEDNTKHIAIVPSGASTGKKEALELRDGGDRYFGKGVLKACDNVNNTIAKKLIGINAYNQALIDHLIKEIDGTENYANIGANAALGVSMAIAGVSAKAQNIPLYRYLGGANAMSVPVPMCNILNGGSHANNSVDFQEYMIIPIGFNKFSDALEAAAKVYHKLKDILAKKGETTSLGDEGGFAPNCANNEEPLQLVIQAIQDAGYKEGKDISLALDCASSEFYKDGLYHLDSEDKKLTSSQLIAYYKNLCEKYPIVSIEDGLDEDDMQGWSEMTEVLGDKIQLVGDDLFVTNTKILQKGIDENIANSILIKPNQIGTVSETMNTVRLAQQNGYNCIMSHRSGESEDTFIADFAVALNTGQIKTGSIARGERTAKYNRLLYIEDEIKYSTFLGKKIFSK
jgi:enolase